MRTCRVNAWARPPVPCASAWPWIATSRPSDSRAPGCVPTPTWGPAEVRLHCRLNGRGQRLVQAALFLSVDTEQVLLVGTLTSHVIVLFWYWSQCNNTFCSRRTPGNWSRRSLCPSRYWPRIDTNQIVDYGSTNVLRCQLTA